MLFKFFGDKISEIINFKKPDNYTIEEFRHLYNVFERFKQFYEENRKALIVTYSKKISKPRITQLLTHKLP